MDVSMHVTSRAAAVLYRVITQAAVSLLGRMLHVAAGQEVLLLKQL